MGKIIKFDREVREKLGDGVKKLNEAVASTLGAKGRNVIFQQGRNYMVTKDGVTVASQITLEDPVEDAACQIVKDAAKRTARDAGDGTTTATVLASAIIEKALQYVGSKSNPMDLKRGIDAAVEEVIVSIDKMKQEVNGEDDTFNIASVSANNDPVIGRMISDIFKKVGKDGAVRLEETQMTDTMVDVVEGCQFGAGYLSPNFVNNAVKKVADYNKVAILITDKAFHESFGDIHPALDLIVEKSNEQQEAIPLLIICGGMDGESLGTLVVNKVKHKLPIVAVSIPDFGAERMEILDDIAVITGGTVISEERGLHIKDMGLEHFGTVDRVIVDSATTTLIGRSGDHEAMQERVKEIEAQLKDDKHAQQTWRLKKRIATITGGVGVIYVGGNSESEMKDSYYRIEDALSATKAAMEDGYVAGGGVALLEASRHRTVASDNRDQSLGMETLYAALSSPLRTIAENCGLEGSVVVDKVSRMKEGYGYDALKDEYGGMIAKGIIDPVKVVKTALKNAASVAGMIITTNCVINDKPKK